MSHDLEFLARRERGSLIETRVHLIAAAAANATVDRLVIGICDRNINAAEDNRNERINKAAKTNGHFMIRYLVVMDGFLMQIRIVERRFACDKATSRAAKFSPNMQLAAQPLIFSVEQQIEFEHVHARLTEQAESTARAGLIYQRLHLRRRDAAHSCHAGYLIRRRGR